MHARFYSATSSAYEENLYFSQITSYRAVGKIISTIVRQSKTIDCAVTCLCNIQCIGFNALSPGDGITCELIATPIVSLQNDKLWNYCEAYVRSIII